MIEAQRTTKSTEQIRVALAVVLLRVDVKSDCESVVVPEEGILIGVLRTAAEKGPVKFNPGVVGQRRGRRSGQSSNKIASQIIVPQRQRMLRAEILLIYKTEALLLHGLPGIEPEIVRCSLHAVRQHLRGGQTARIVGQRGVYGIARR